MRGHSVGGFGSVTTNKVIATIVGQVFGKDVQAEPALEARLEQVSDPLMDDIRKTHRFFKEVGPSDERYINDNLLIDIMLKEQSHVYVGGAGSCAGCWLRGKTAWITGICSRNWPGDRGQERGVRGQDGGDERTGAWGESLRAITVCCVETGATKARQARTVRYACQRFQLFAGASSIILSELCPCCPLPPDP